MQNFKRTVLMTIVLALLCSAADGQIAVQRVAKFGDPNERGGRFSGGREVEFTDNGLVMIVAFHGSTVQLFDLGNNAPIGEPIRTAGDGEVGFVNEEIAYTADWESVRFWDTNTGRQVGDAIRHELREDTIIPPAISHDGTLIATRATMNSVQLADVTTREMIGRELKYTAEVNSIRFSADGKLLFVRVGGFLHAIDTETGEKVAEPIKSGWLFRFLPEHQRLVTTERVDESSERLVIRSTDEMNWPVTYQAELSGRAKRMSAFDEDKLLLQVQNSNYTPSIYIYPLDDPENRTEVESNADRAFGVVVTQDCRYWVCSNIRDIRCQRFGEAEPVWLKQIPRSGYDQHLFPFDNEHFILIDKEDNFGVYKIADGSEVWNQSGVNRFRLTDGKLALCNREGVEVWSWE